MRPVLLVVGLLVGCGATPAATPIRGGPPAATSGNANGAPITIAGGGVRVSWSELVSTPGCFFFSGPVDLGRDDHLGESATMATRDGALSLDFGSGVVFTGAADASTLLGRSAPHDYGGRWTTRESLRLERAGEVWVGTYHYDEIEGTSASPGTCHIDARVLVAPAR